MRLGIFGTVESEVLRQVLLEGIRQIHKDRLIEKTLDARRKARETNG